MKFLEKDLEQIIWESDMLELRNRGLNIHGKIYRQKRIGNYGVADIITVERGYSTLENSGSLIITIYEIRQEKIGISAFLRSIGYARGIKSYLDNKRSFYGYEIRIVLIGSSIDTSGNFIYLADLLKYPSENDMMLNSIEFYVYNYKLDGVHFERECGYILEEEGF